MIKVVLGSVFALMISQATFAAPILLEYQCRGRHISGVVQIQLSEYPKMSPPYNWNPEFYAISHLKIDGHERVIENQDELTYFRKVSDRWGSWEYDENRWIYELGGWELGLSPLWTEEPFYLEVKLGSFGHIKGYLAPRDAQLGQWPAPTRYDFKCKQYFRN